MNKTKLLVMALGALVALPASAEDATQGPVTAYAGLVNNYLFRGISRSGAKPAVQAAFDYNNASGFYVGVFGSSVTWLGDRAVATSSGVELDTYLGIKNNFADDFNYDLGYVRYTFPGTLVPGATTADTAEVQGALGYKWAALKYSYALSNAYGIPQAKGSNYLDFSINYQIEDSGFALLAHIGKQTFKGAAADALKLAGSDPSYADAKLGVSYTVSGYTLGAAYSKTNAPKGAGAYYNVLGRDLGRGAAVVSLSRTF